MSTGMQAGTQYPTRRPRLLGWLMFLFLSPAMAAQEGSLEEGMVNPGYVEKPDWFKNSFLDLREDVAEAAASGKRVMLYFYQDGCPYCEKLIRDNFSQRHIIRKARKYFDVIAINMWGDREVTDMQGRVTTEKAFSAALRVQFTPTILFLNEQGKVAYRINGYYHPRKFEAAMDYVHGKFEGKMSFRDYFARRAPPAASGKLHEQPFYLKPPYDLAKVMADSPKPLLVIFEQVNCRVCDEWEGDIFRREETLKQIRRLNVVRFDLWADTPLVTPQGRKTTARAWARELNITTAPSMVFFDGPKREEVARVDAYLKAFHIQSVMDYVASRAYKTQPEFQRYISDRAAALEAQGVHIDLWK